MEETIYSIDGKKSGAVSLPKNIFGLSWNADLVKQVADSLLSARRKPIAHTKTRGEVRGGGKKPWQQKGTGRARHGSIRSPLWVGGGVTGGPRKDKNFFRKVSTKTRIKALHTILSRKAKDGELLLVDSLHLTEPKTREALKTLKSLSVVKGFEYLFSKKNNATLIVFAEKDKKNERAFNNLGNIETVEARNLDPISLLTYKYLVIENPKKALTLLPGTKVKENAKS